jgi:hypothetical protein
MAARTKLVTLTATAEFKVDGVTLPAGSYPGKRVEIMIGGNPATAPEYKITVNARAAMSKGLEGTLGA